MAEERLSPPGVSMFDRSSSQAFQNSNFTGVGRDHVTVNVAVATVGQPPSPPPQEPTKHVRDPSIVSGLFRGLRRGKRRMHSTGQDRQDNESVPHSPTPPPPPACSSPSPPLRPSLADVTVLSDGSSLSSIDSPSQSPSPRPCASNEEEMYERSFLPKGQGYPLYNPSPFGRPARLGDVGIITPDGFQPFGNLYVPEDQERFSIVTPPKEEAVCQLEKFKQGQTLVIGMEDARRLTSGGNENETGLSFEFRCREAQGAVLALTSSAMLETLAPPSKKELKRYLCCHGRQLMANLRRKDYLDPGESLYVVTGTIKSDSWGIAVHTSPMREPYDYVVLTKRMEKAGDTLIDSYEWTSRGKADARYGESTSIDHNGRRTKDQSLFLRGFLITPSHRMEVPSFPGEGDSSARNPSSGSDSPDRGDRKPQAPTKERDSKGTGSKNSNGYSPAGNHQLHDVEVVPFASPNPKNYYPSLYINKALLQDTDADLAITHDDDWRGIIEDKYLDDDSLATLLKLVQDSTAPSIHSGVAEMTSPVVEGHNPETFRWLNSLTPMAIDSDCQREQSSPEPDVDSFWDCPGTPDTPGTPDLTTPESTADISPESSPSEDWDRMGTMAPSCYDPSPSFPQFHGPPAEGKPLPSQGVRKWELGFGNCVWQD